MRPARAPKLPRRRRPGNWCAPVDFICQWLKESDRPAVGQKVKAGQQIGTSDGTGNITKPHLHYTYRPGTLANPATPGSAKVNPLTTQFAGMSYAVVP